MYTSIEKIIAQISEATLIQLTDDNGQEIVNTTHVDDAITNANAVIDGYCSGRYIVPFNPVPDIIAKCALDMAIYNLYARRVESMPDVRDKNNSAAAKLLTAISNGTITLGSTAVVAPPGNGNTLAMVRTNDRIFTSIKMDTY